MTPKYYKMLRRAEPGCTDLILDVDDRERTEPILPLCANCPETCKVHRAPNLNFYCYVRPKVAGEMVF